LNGSCLLYLAYGSNLHPLRLQERVPSAIFSGTTALAGYQLRFNKRGEDGSVKCNLMPTGDARHRVYGAVFKINAGDKPALDRAESGYDEIEIEIPHGGETVTAFTYIAQPENIDDTLKPFDWYKAMVLLGVRYHHFPNEYLRQVEAVVPVLDRDKQRRAHRKKILATLMEANARQL